MDMYSDLTTTSKAGSHHLSVSHTRLNVYFNKCVSDPLKKGRSWIDDNPLSSNRLTDIFYVSRWKQLEELVLSLPAPHTHPRMSQQYCGLKQQVFLCQNEGQT